MALIEAAPRAIRGSIQSGIRPFDIARDLRPVAELIADAFTNELDPRGLAALREMRIMSHLSGLLKVLSRSTGDLDDVFSGFVWVEDDNIVGNVTVQRADKYGNRWHCQCRRSSRLSRAGYCQEIDATSAGSRDRLGWTLGCLASL